MKIQAVLWCYFLIFGTAFSQPLLEFEQEGKVVGMETRMAQEQTKGVAMVVLLDGETVLRQQWGMRDAENNLPVTENTVFQIGSMSQPVTQFAILRLVDEGKLDLDTDINQYLTSWQLPENKITAQRPVSIRDLCLQRRGFKFPYKPAGYPQGAATPTHLQLLKGEKPARNPKVKLQKDLNKSGDNSFAPALILQQILMDYYQQPFPQIIQEQVFDPLGMEHSFFATEPTTAQRVELAVGYGPDKQRLAGDFLRFPELAASGMYTTAYDYALFVQAMLAPLKGETSGLISPTLAKQVLLPTNQDETFLFNRSGDNFTWGGATKGFYTQFEADAREQRWVVVALMNDHINWRFNGELRGKGIELAQEMIAAKK